jgi:ubiquinone/menaquinone biosynthesis C-methylase UbiE
VEFLKGEIESIPLPDNSVDVIISNCVINLSSDKPRAVAEAFRVLKPGGVLSLSTEYRIAGPPGQFRNTLLFDEEELVEHVAGDRDWHPISPLELEVSEATMGTAVDQEAIVADFERHFERHGELVPHALDFSSYPRLVVRAGDRLFTSVHLALRKGGG